MEFIDSYTADMVRQYEEKVEKLFKYKLGLLVNKTAGEGDYDFYGTVKRLNESNINQIVLELKEKGYAIEFEHPQVDFTRKQSILKATIDTEKVV